MKISTLLALVLALAPCAWGVGNMPVTVDVAAPQRELDLETAQGTTRGWDITLLNDGVAWTNATGYTGTLYYAATYTGTPSVVAITGGTVTSNLFSITPTVGQTATSGVFVCQMIIADGTNTIEAGRGALEIRPTMMVGGVLITLSLSEFATTNDLDAYIAKHDDEGTNTVFRDSGGVVSIDASNRVLRQSEGVRVLNWDAQRLYATNGSISVWWHARVAYDAAGVDSMGWQARGLKDANGVGSLEWNTRLLYAAGGWPSLDWQNYLLNDGAGNECLNWSNFTFSAGPWSFATNLFIQEPTVSSNPVTLAYFEAGTGAIPAGVWTDDGDGTITYTATNTGQPSVLIAGGAMAANAIQFGISNANNDTVFTVDEDGKVVALDSISSGGGSGDYVRMDGNGVLWLFAAGSPSVQWEDTAGSPSTDFKMDVDGGRWRLANADNSVRYIIVNTGGDVVIGTNFTPGARLHVNDTDGGTAFLVMSNSTELLVVNSSGDVGLSTNTPAAKLHVNDTDGGTAFLITSNELQVLIVDYLHNVLIGPSSAPPYGHLQVNDTDGWDAFRIVSNDVEMLAVDAGTGDTDIRGTIEHEPVCGQLFFDGLTEQNLTANWQIITNLVTTNLSNFAGTSSNLTASLAGMYSASFQLSAGLGNNEDIHAALFVDGVEAEGVKGHASTPAAGEDHINCSGIGLLNLTAGQVITLQVQSHDAAADFDPESIQVTLDRRGAGI